MVALNYLPLEFENVHCSQEIWQLKSLSKCQSTMYVVSFWPDISYGQKEQEKAKRRGKKKKKRKSKARSEFSI